MNMQDLYERYNIFKDRMFTPVFCQTANGDNFI
jgi:hypothetical protein